MWLINRVMFCQQTDYRYLAVMNLPLGQSMCMYYKCGFTQQSSLFQEPKGRFTPHNFCLKLSHDLSWVVLCKSSMQLTYNNIWVFNCYFCQAKSCHLPILGIVLLWSKLYHNYYFILSGVADGVSSWRHAGTDPSIFPNMLMANCMKHLEDCQGKINLEELLSSAYSEILQNNQVEAGTSRNI